MRTTALLGSLLVLASSGCVVQNGPFTVLAPGPIRTAGLDLGTAPRQEAVQGKSTAFRVWGIGQGRASLPAAIREALRGGQGDLLTNVTLTSYWWSVPFYDQDGWTVVGDVVSTR